MLVKMAKGRTKLKMCRMTRMTMRMSYGEEDEDAFMSEDDDADMGD